MVKKVFLVLILVLITLTTFAQNIPEWFYKKPKPSNNTYRYDPEYGSGESELEARNLAIAKGFQEAAKRVGQPVDSDVINEAIQNGTNFKVLSSQYNIPISKVCEYTDKTTEGYTVYMLFQIAISGNIIPVFDDTFNDCYKMVTDHSEDWKALKMSILPGGGQFYKNHPGLAWTIIGSEALLIGGGVACYFIGQNQQDIMNNHKTKYNEYKAAESKYNTVTTLQPWFYGAAAAVYVANLATAYWINDNRDNKSLTLVPTIIPTNNDLAVGASISLKF